jgi:hypothetical protein
MPSSYVHKLKEFFYGHSHQFNILNTEAYIGTFNPLKVINEDVPTDKNSGFAVWEPSSNNVYTCTFQNVWEQYWIVSILPVMRVVYFGITTFQFIKYRRNLFRGYAILFNVNDDHNMSLLCQHNDVPINISKWYHLLYV